MVKPKHTSATKRKPVNLLGIATKNKKTQNKAKALPWAKNNNYSGPGNTWVPDRNRKTQPLPTYWAGTNHQIRAKKRKSK